MGASCCAQRVENPFLSKGYKPPEKMEEVIDFNFLDDSFAGTESNHDNITPG